MLKMAHGVSQELKAVSVFEKPTECVVREWIRSIGKGGLIELKNGLGRLSAQPERLGEFKTCLSKLGTAFFPMPAGVVRTESFGD